LSEYITHTAIVDDGARLANYSPTICRAFKIALRERPDLVRSGGTTRSGDQFTVQLLDHARQRWAGRKKGDFVVEKLAFVLGWRLHLAADRQFKPVYRMLQPEHYAAGDTEGRPSDVSVYHDVIVFREVYAGGTLPPFFPSMLDYRAESHPGWSGFPAAKAERLMQALWQKSLAATQSFVLQEKDPEKWMAMLLKRFEPFTVDIQRYARAYHAPDPDLLRRFIIEPNFYDPQDPLIALARSIQRGKPDPSIHIANAVDAAAKQSQYAQGLARACRYLQAASDYFEGKISEEELKIRSDVGKPHVPPSLVPKKG
jgi:hypothetical protein